MKPRARYLALFSGHTRAAADKTQPQCGPAPPCPAPVLATSGLGWFCRQPPPNNPTTTTVMQVQVSTLCQLLTCLNCEIAMLVENLRKQVESLLPLAFSTSWRGSEFQPPKTKTVTDITTPTGRILQRPRGMLGSGTRNHVCGLYLFHLTYEGLEAELSTDV